MTEPKLLNINQRITSDEDWIDLECMFEDGQKFVAIQVDQNFPQLANIITAKLAQWAAWNQEFNGAA